MVEIEIKLNKSSGSVSQSFSMASRWNELSRSQLLYIGQHWQTWQIMMSSEMNIQKAKAMLFLNLLNCASVKEQKKVAETLSFMREEEVEINFLGLTNFIFENMNLTINLVPSIRTGALTVVYGPDDQLKNISIEEFAFAFHFFQLYARYRKDSDLDLLVSTLYRKRGANGLERGDQREPFNINLIESNLANISGMPEAYKQAIYLFFYGCLEHLSKYFDLVFRRAEKQENKNASNPFMDVVIGISGDKFGTFDQTRVMNLYIILSELQKILDRKDQK